MKALPWAQVAESGSFKALQPEQKDAARRQYFDDVVAPQVPVEQHDVAWDQFSTAAGVGRRDLPVGVAPSSAGGGRGSVNPGMPAPRVRNEPTQTSDEQGTPLIGTEPFTADRTSVLDGRQIAAPQFDAAEAARLSDRATAEATPVPGTPRRSLPELRPSSGRTAPTVATERGQALQDAPLPVRAGFQAVAGVAQGAAGAMRAAGDLLGSSDLARAGAETGKGAEEFQQGMGKTEPVAGFGPKSPVPYLADMAEGAASSLGQTAAYASMFGPRAVIPLMSMMTAGQEYDQARNAGLDPAAALAGAIPKGAFEAIGEKFSGLDKVAGAMGTLLQRGATDQAKKTAADVLIKSGIKEIPGEVVTYLGQTGVDLLPGIGLNPNLTMGQFVDGLRDTVVQAGMMGGAMGVGGAAVKADPRIKRLRDAGETAAADLMQGRLDRENTAASVEGELAGITPLADFAAAPAFQEDYRALRTEGVKPVEAAGRSALTSTFRGLAGTVGMSDKAVAAALDAGKKLGIDKLPGFLQRFTQSLAAKGAITLSEDVDLTSLEQTRDHAMNAAIGATLPVEGGVRDTMDQVEALEASQAASVPENTGLVPAEGGLVPESPASAHIDVAAHDAATSPLNDRPEPTDAQKEAGNYKVGRVNMHGLNISIENPEGSVRRGVGDDGKPWQNELAAHYGYIRGTEGNDGDHVDTFIGPNPDSQKVFVVDQVNKDGSFDEHKVMLGADSLQQADDLYHANYHEGWTGRGAITEMPMTDFKAWVRDGVKTQPLGTLKTATTQGPDVEDAPSASPAPPATSATAAGEAARGEAPAPAGVAGGPAAAGVEARGGDVEAAGVASPADAGVPFSAFPSTLRADGTLAITGDPVAIRAALSAIPARSVAGMKGGILVGKTQAAKAQTILAGEVVKPTARQAAAAGAATREAEKQEQKRAARADGKAAPAGLSVGTMPSNAEAITVKDGVVRIGKYAAQNYETGDDVTVAVGASDEQVVAALKEAGALAARQRVFGLSKGDESPVLAKDFDADAFRRHYGPAQGMTVAAARQVTDRISAKWQNGPRIVVVNTAADLPMQGIPRSARGLYTKSAVYVIAANNKSADWVARTLAHEAIAHHGLREALGQDGWKKLMGNIQLAIKSGNKPLTELQAYIREAYADQKLSPNLEADEIAARAVEQAVDAATGEFRPGFGFVKQAYARIAEWLRSIGIDIPFTMAELHGMLQAAMKSLEVGKRTLGGGDVVVAAARGDAPVSIPPVMIGSTLGSGTSHPDYTAAKAGDPASAVRLAADLVTDEVVRKVRAAIGKATPIVVPVMSEEATGRNRIPAAVALQLADKLGLQTAQQIFQSNRPKRTTLDGLDRIFAGPEFSGPVVRGQQYLLVDDTLTQGATFAALASHITDNGGQVLGAFALTGKQYSADLAPNPGTLTKLRAKHGDIETDFRAATGYGFDALTQSEARYLASFEPAETVRTRILEAGQSARDARDADADGQGQPDLQGSVEPPRLAVAVAEARQAVTDTPAFRKWFGASRVVDDAGAPLVVYHGTNKTEDGEAFRMFDAYGSNYGLFGQGAYFTADPSVASSYTNKGRGTSPTVYPAYMSIKNPIDMDAKADQAAWEKGFADADFDTYTPEGTTNEAFYRAMEENFRDQEIERWEGAEAMQGGLRNMGYDGITHIGGGRVKSEGVRHKVFIAFDPEQIKSATGNNGDFDGGNGSIMLATGNLFQPNIWSMPDPTRMDRLTYELQDAKVDLKRVQEAITKSGQDIDEKWDARLAETLYPGRVAHRSQAFLETEAKPLLEAMARNKVPMDELADYLHARGAEERNAQIAIVNPKLKDGGAGTNTKGVLMTDQAARAHLASIAPARKTVLAAMAARVDKVTAGTRQLLVSEGLEKQSTIDAWQAVYKNYVPMFRDEAESGAPSHPTGSGFTVKGPSSQRATGSTKEVTNILAHVLMQREAVITRAEKNRVALALYGQALSHPNPEFWTTIKPSMSPAAIGAELVAMGVDPLTAQVGMEGIPTIRGVDPVTNKVVDRPNPIYKNLPGAIPLKVNGDDRVLMINTKTERGMRMAEALKNLDGLTKLDLANNIIGKSTRWLAAVNTQYNPAFGLANLTRDVMEGAINLGSTELRGNAVRVLAQVPLAIQGIGRHLAGGKGKNAWGDLYAEFVAAGGQTGFKENFRDANDRARAVEKELAQLSTARKLSPGRAAHALLDLLDGFNTTLENAVRLSAYKVGLQEGMTSVKAARLGRELTVDFNRKGRAGREVGPLYAFFNAAVQGMERSVRTLTGPTGGRIIAGGLALGVIQALMLAAAGYDDDDIPEFVKTRAFIIPLLGGEKKYIAIPMPLGFLTIPNTGRVLTELTLNGGKEAGKRVFHAIGEIAGSFNPLGGGNVFTADGALKTVAPTLVDPLIEIGFNRNFAGGTIEKQPYGGETDGRPGVARTKESTQRAATGQAYIGISKAINTMAGGNEYQAGVVSPTPERLRYIAQTIGGGVLRELEKTINASVLASRGEKVKPSAIPVAGRFYGEVDDDQVAMTKFYKKSKELDTLQSSLKAAMKAGDGEAVLRIMNDHPEAALMHFNDKTQTELAKLNKLAVSVVQDREQMKMVDDARVARMKALNDAVLQMEEATGKVTLGQKLRAKTAPKVAAAEP